MNLSRVFCQSRKYFFFLFFAGMSAVLCGAGLYEVIAEAETVIRKKYPHSQIAQKMATEDLWKIANDPALTEEEKIRQIRAKFPLLAELTDDNILELIHVQPITWRIHSLSIVRNVQTSENVLVSVEKLKQNREQRQNNVKRTEGTGTTETSKRGDGNDIN